MSWVRDESASSAKYNLIEGPARKIYLFEYEVFQV